MDRKEEFIIQIQQSQGLINKILFLYANNYEDRRDLRQEILSNAWRAYGNFRGEAKFSTWLYRIGVNVAISSLRKKSKETELIHPPSSKDVYAGRSDKELLDFILKILNPIEKSLVLLLIEGFNQQEIAETLGMTPENTRVKIFRLRKKLEANGVKEFVEK